MVAHRIPLPAIMDIPACNELHEQVMERLSTGETLELDAAQVERITTPGIQLLLAALKNAPPESRQVTLVNLSPILTQAIDDLALLTLFQSCMDDGKVAL